MLLISAYTGMGSRRWLAMLTSARPPWREPVNPTALMAGCATSASPMVRPAPISRENTPSGMPVRCAAFCTARPTSSDVPRCALCALTITGAPAASADAVSPPATENARGKLLAPNTATGPSGTFAWRKSARGSGWRSGCALSTMAPRKWPSRTTCANRRSWPMVRPRSPVSRATGKPLSWCAR
ncbi:hypothetical protein D3C87_1548350 [compost metagenome]